MTESLTCTEGVLSGFDFLVVDEDLVAARVLNVLLRELGANVRMALGAAQAVEMMIDKMPDIVITELELEGMSGYELVRQVRSAYRLAGPVMVALTSLDRSIHASRSARSGFDKFLNKPILIEDLFGIFAPSYAGAWRQRGRQRSQ